jgi:hypothetical protein
MTDGVYKSWENELEDWLYSTTLVLEKFYEFEIVRCSSMITSHESQFKW